MCPERKRETRILKARPPEALLERTAVGRDFLDVSRRQPTKKRPTPGGGVGRQAPGLYGRALDTGREAGVASDAFG